MTSFFASIIRASRFLFNNRGSNVPGKTVYCPLNHNLKITVDHLMIKHKYKNPIYVSPVFDYQSAVRMEKYSCDMGLVCDSASLVSHRYRIPNDTTLPMSLDELLVRCKDVARGAKRLLLVADLTSIIHGYSPDQAVDTARRIVKEGGMDAIKMEGGSPSRITAAKAIVEAGISVMGTVGLSPQSSSLVHLLYPETIVETVRKEVVENAVSLQEAGCFSVLLEYGPAPVALKATAALSIPTIGIESGPPFCSGQVLIHDNILCTQQGLHVTNAEGTSQEVKPENMSSPRL